MMAALQSTQTRPKFQYYFPVPQRPLPTVFCISSRVVFRSLLHRAFTTMDFSCLCVAKGVQCV